MKADQTNTLFAMKKFDKAIVIIYQSLYIKIYGVVYD